VVEAFLSEAEADDYARELGLPEQCQRDGGSWKIAKREVHIA
jgi:hypothetical protein